MALKHFQFARVLSLITPLTSVPPLDESNCLCTLEQNLRNAIDDQQPPLNILLQIPVVLMLPRVDPPVSLLVLFTKIS